MSSTMKLPNVWYGPSLHYGAGTSVATETISRKRLFNSENPSDETRTGKRLRVGGLFDRHEWTLQPLQLQRETDGEQKWESWIFVDQDGNRAALVPEKAGPNGHIAGGKPTTKLTPCKLFFNEHETDGRYIIKEQLDSDGLNDFFENLERHSNEIDGFNDHMIMARNLGVFGGDPRMHYSLLQEVKGPDLFAYVENLYNDGQMLRVEIAIQWLDQIYKQLVKLHKHGYKYYDLKPENIMLDQSMLSTKPRLVLCDLESMHPSRNGKYANTYHCYPHVADEYTDEPSTHLHAAAEYTDAPSTHLHAAADYTDNPSTDPHVEGKYNEMHYKSCTALNLAICLLFMIDTLVFAENCDGMTMQPPENIISALRDQDRNRCILQKFFPTSSDRETYLTEALSKVADGQYSFLAKLGSTVPKERIAVVTDTNGDWKPSLEPVQQLTPQRSASEE